MTIFGLLFDRDNQFFICFRIDKDKSQIMIEIADVRAATDEVGRSKVSWLSNTLA